MLVPTKKMIVLRSSDNQTFEVEEAAAILSPTIKHLIEDDDSDAVIPIPNVTGEILAMVVAYMKKHTDPTAINEELTIFDWELVDIDVNFLYALMEAAICLDIKSLLNLGCSKAASLIRGKTPEEIRAIFHIANDFTPEAEKEMVREMKKWAF